MLRLIQKALRQAFSTLKRKAIESVEYADPNIPFIGVFSFTGFVIFYYPLVFVLHQTYDSLPLRLAAAIQSLPLFFYRHLPDFTRKLFPWYFMLECILLIPCFFFFMLLKNEWSMVWALATLSGLMLLVHLIHDWFIISLMILIGYGLAYLTVMLLDGQVLYTHYNMAYPIDFVFVLYGSLAMTYRRQSWHERQLAMVKSLGGTIAHEMRTPLNAITNAIDSVKSMLPQPVENDTANERSFVITNSSLAKILEVIDLESKSIRTGNKIIDSILSILSGGNVDRNQFRRHSAIECIQTALTRFSFRSAEEKNLIHLNLSRDFDFFGDRDLLIHLLFNLLKNALHYQQKPGFHIDVSIYATSTVNRIIVRDTGPGIVAGNLERIFTQFYTSGKPGGNGLGLSFSRRVAESFGGGLVCRSVVNEWTEFIIELPPYESKTVENIKREILGMKKLLIVDGQPVNRTMMCKMLSDVVCCTDEAENGTIALEMAAKTKYDLILTSIEIPETVDREMITKLRTGVGINPSMLQHYRNVPIIGVTSAPESDARRHTSSAGMDECLLRPFDRQTLLALFERHFFIEKDDRTPEASENVEAATILVVDDDRLTRTLMKTSLQSSKYRVFMAEDGAQAIELLEQEEIDLVLMDMEMPIMGGIETTKTIRSGLSFKRFKQFRTIPIIITTGYNDEQTVSEIMLAGGTAHLGKPVHRETLFSTISFWLLSGNKSHEQASNMESAMAATSEDATDSSELIDMSFIQALRQSGDDDLIKQLVELFVKDAINIIETLESAARECNLEKAIRSSQTLIGSAASIGASRMQALGTRINKIMHQGQLPEENGWVEELRHTYKLTVEAFAVLFQG